MSQDEAYSRKGFFSEFFGFVRKGVANHMDKKLAKVLDAPIRPPGALDEVEFLSTCTRCDACIHACPYHVLQKLPLQAGMGANTPYVEPATQACKLCTDFPCIQACEVGALLPTLPENVEMGKAVVNEESCHTYNDKICTLCYDACPFPEQALTVDENFHPEVLEGCVGCGQCEQRCPTHPVGIRVFSPLNFQVEKADRELYFGVIEKRD